MNAADRRSWFMQQQDTAMERAWGLDPSDFDPDHVARILETVGRIYGEHKWFDTTITGWEHVPDRPTLFVANHSGGTSMPDAWGFVHGWYTRFGLERPLHGLAHEAVFSNKFTGEFFARGGILRAQRDIAQVVLTHHQRSLLVMPGGDRDVWRPWSKRHQVEFAGRKGYARSAIEAGVDICPVAHVGAHSTLMVLSDGRRLAKLLHLKQIARASIMPIHLSLPFGLTLLPVPHLPLPARFLYRIGSPVEAPVKVEPGQPAPEWAVDAYDRRVRHELQGLMHQLAAEGGGLRGRVKRELERVRGRLTP